MDIQSSQAFQAARAIYNNYFSKPQGPVISTDQLKQMAVLDINDVASKVFEGLGNSEVQVPKDWKGSSGRNIDMMVG